MTATSSVPRKRLIVFRAACAAGALLSALVAGCGTMKFDLEATPVLDGLPQVNKSQLHAGLYYSPQFASYAHVRRYGEGEYHMHIGPASARYFDQLLPRVFAKVSRVEKLAADELAKKGVDVVVVPSLEHFDFPLGLEPYSERFGVAYRITLYTPLGVPLSSWVIYGTKDHWGTFGGHIEAYIQRAGTNFVETFEKQGGPGLATVTALRQRPAQPIDVPSLQFSARHTEPVSFDASAKAQLRKAGFVFVEVEGRVKAPRALVVRASDMQLRLKDGRMIDSSPPSALLVIAAGQTGTPVVAGVSPFGGIIASLAMQAAASAESDKQRGSLNRAASAEFFGERVIGQDTGQDGGVVFFRLPPGSSADGATVLLWALEPATAAGSQLQLPLLGTVQSR